MDRKRFLRLNKCRAVELPLYLLLAWYFGQVVGTGTGSQKHPLFFLRWQSKQEKNGNDTLADNNLNESQPMPGDTTSILGRWHRFGRSKTHPLSNCEPMKVGSKYLIPI